MTTPLVSIIVPTKNSAATLQDALASIRAQDYPAIELIVVDNFSKDETHAIAQQYADLVLTVGPERCTQRNHGARHATGDYMVFIDSDMVLAPDIITVCVAAMNAHPEYAGVIIPEESFGKGFWAQCKRFERSFYLGVPWMEAARFFKRDVFLAVGGYDEQLISGEDWDLSHRARQYGPHGRISSFIYHNEGRISLAKTLRKKYYYAKHFRRYAEKTKHHGEYNRQTNPLYRYGLYFRSPLRLIAHPLLSIGMLTMKTCEFAVGAYGYVSARRMSRSSL